jgi:hypothetical protein
MNQDQECAHCLSGKLPKATELYYTFLLSIFFALGAFAFACYAFIEESLTMRWVTFTLAIFIAGIADFLWKQHSYVRAIVYISRDINGTVHIHRREETTTRNSYRWWATPCVFWNPQESTKATETVARSKDSPLLVLCFGWPWRTKLYGTCTDWWSIKRRGNYLIMTDCAEDTLQIYIAESVDGKGTLRLSSTNLGNVFNILAHHAYVTHIVKAASRLHTKSAAVAGRVG